MCCCKVHTHSVGGTLQKYWVPVGEMMRHHGAKWGKNTLIQQVLLVKSSFVAELVDGVPSARPRTLTVVLQKLRN